MPQSSACSIDFFRHFFFPLSVIEREARFRGASFLWIASQPLLAIKVVVIFTPCQEDSNDFTLSRARILRRGGVKWQQVVRTQVQERRRFPRTFQLSVVCPERSRGRWACLSPCGLVSSLVSYRNPPPTNVCGAWDNRCVLRELYAAC